MFFYHPRLSEGALHGRSSALCTLSGALEYWLAEARVDETAKVTVWGGVGDREC